jgi:hypothetical protein
MGAGQSSASPSVQQSHRLWPPEVEAEIFKLSEVWKISDLSPEAADKHSTCTDGIMIDSTAYLFVEFRISECKCIYASS